MSNTAYHVLPDHHGETEAPPPDYANAMAETQMTTSPQRVAEAPMMISMQMPMVTTPAIVSPSYAVSNFNYELARIPISLRGCSWEITAGSHNFHAYPNLSQYMTIEEYNTSVNRIFQQGRVPTSYLIGIVLGLLFFALSIVFFVFFTGYLFFISIPGLLIAIFLIRRGRTQAFANLCFAAGMEESYYKQPGRVPLRWFVDSYAYVVISIDVNSTTRTSIVTPAVQNANVMVVQQQPQVYTQQFYGTQV